MSRQSESKANERLLVVVKSYVTPSEVDASLFSDLGGGVLVAAIRDSAVEWTEDVVGECDKVLRFGDCDDGDT
jgi:hypothetical protein